MRFASGRAGSGRARFMRFVMVGIAGFLADNAVLAALHYGAGTSPFSARVVSMLLATLVTWRLNRSITFASKAPNQATEGLRYLSVVSVSLAINYAVYALVLTLEPHLPPFVGVMAGAAAAMGFSYLGYSLFVFTSPRPAVSGSPSEQSR